MRSIPLLGVVAAAGAAAVAAQRCALRFDGRVSREAGLAVFDAGESLFNQGYVKGAGES